MKADTQAGIPDTEGTSGKALKRRGILAAAAAVVAGMVAKQTSEPVAAAPVTADYFSANGTASYGYDTFLGTFATGVYAQGTATGVYARGTNVGITSISTNGYGVYGISYGDHAVFGNLGAPQGSGKAAVFGLGNGNGTFGVLGDGFSGSGVGVQGQSKDAAGIGVKGVSTNGFPLIGIAIANTNPAPGVLGLGTAGPGMQGQSGASHGLIGYTGASDGHAGLVGYGIYAGSVGLIGVAPGYGTGTVGNAGVFYGNVHIQGIFDAPQMRAVVKHQGDGTYRALHTLATPEGWVEDFGTGTLAADKADITLDHDFVALIDPGTLHVFLTPHGPQHLHVAQQSAAGFTVIATPVGGAGGPKRAEGTGTFAWRVVGKRKDIATGRLAKVAAPTAPKALASFTIPETPVVTTPDVKNAPGGKSPTDRP